jgi:hypothetical protein
MIERHLPAVLPRREADPPLGAALVWLAWLLAVLGLAWGLAGCDTIHIVLPGVPTPVPSTTPTPAPSAPTPVPTPEIRQLTSGRAVLEISGLDSLPLSPTRDNLILSTLTWETEGNDRSVPVLELAIRGTSPEPCLSRTPARGCRDAAGLVARYSSNLAFDSTLPWDAEHEKQSAEQACGAGVNYHQRLALGAYGSGGALRVTVEWTPDSITVRTPADAWTLAPRVAGSVGLGRVVAGAPWPRNEARGWLWNGFSAGRPVRVVQWSGAGSGPLGACP